MIDFLQFIDETNNAKSEEEIFNLFQKQLAHLGFDRVLYALMTDHNSIGQKAGHGIMRSYPEDWMKYYTEQDYIAIDPVRKHVVLSSHPFIWDEMDKRMPATKEQKKLLNEAEEAGLRCGVGLGIHCANNEIAALGFASSEHGVDLRPNTISLAKALANQFHYAYCELKKKTQVPVTQEINLNLTRKELEVLHWISAGKSNNVTADIMGISENTVDFHMRSIYKKLDVNDRILATVKAIKYGLIKI